MKYVIGLKYWFFFSKFCEKLNKNNVDPLPREKKIHGSLEFEHVLGVALQISKFGRIFFSLLYLYIPVLFLSIDFFMDSIIRLGRLKPLESEIEIVLVI